MKLFKYIYLYYFEIAGSIVSGRGDTTMRLFEPIDEPHFLTQVSFYSFFKKLILFLLLLRLLIWFDSNIIMLKLFSLSLLPRHLLYYYFCCVHVSSLVATQLSALPRCRSAAATCAP